MRHWNRPLHIGHAWSVEVYRQVRRIDLRTGYAGPKPTLIARAHCAVLSLFGRQPLR